MSFSFNWRKTESNVYKQGVGVFMQHTLHNGDLQWSCINGIVQKFINKYFCKELIAKCCSDCSAKIVTVIYKMCYMYFLAQYEIP